MGVNVTGKIPMPLWDRLKQHCEDKGYTVSEAVRRFIEQGLQQVNREGQPAEPEDEMDTKGVDMEDTGLLRLLVEKVEELREKQIEDKHNVEKALQELSEDVASLRDTQKAKETELRTLREGLLELADLREKLQKVPTRGEVDQKISQVVEGVVSESFEEGRRVLEEAKQKVEEVRDRVESFCSQFPELCKVSIKASIAEAVEKLSEEKREPTGEGVHSVSEGFEKIVPSAYLDFLEKHVEECPSCREVKDKIAAKLLEVGKKLGGVIPQKGEEVIPKEAERREERKSNWWFDF